MTTFKKCLLGLLALVGSSCSVVSSANPGLSTATGEAWYTKDKFFLIFHLGSEVYYCPTSAKKCFLAKME